MNWKNYKEQSKLEWGKEVLNDKCVITLEELKLGCLLRISDSLENMEQPYIELLQIIENYKELEAENKRLKNTIAGLKGYIKKIKKV